MDAMYVAVDLYQNPYYETIQYTQFWTTFKLQNKVQC